MKVLHDLGLNGKTIIITTHNPNHAITLESDSCFLQNGEIVSFGKSSEIICNELLQRIYGHNVILNHGKTIDAVVFNKDFIQC